MVVQFEGRVYIKAIQMRVLIACQDAEVMCSVARLWNEKGECTRQTQENRAKQERPLHTTKDDGDPLNVFPPSNSPCVSEKDSHGSNKGTEVDEEDNGRENRQESERQ